MNHLIQYDYTLTVSVSTYVHLLNLGTQKISEDSEDVESGGPCLAKMFSNVHKMHRFRSS